MSEKLICFFPAWRKLALEWVCLNLQNALKMMEVFFNPFTKEKKHPISIAMTGDLMYVWRPILFEKVARWNSHFSTPNQTFLIHQRNTLQSRLGGRSFLQIFFFFERTDCCRCKIFSTFEIRFWLFTIRSIQNWNIYKMKIIWRIDFLLLKITTKWRMGRICEWMND